MFVRPLGSYMIGVQAFCWNFQGFLSVVPPMKVHIVETQRPGPLLEELVYYFQESLVKLEGSFLHYKSR